MEKSTLIAVALAWAALTANVARAEEIAAPPQTIEQRLSILERKYEIDREEAAARAAAKPADLKINAYIQSDYRDYLSDNDAFTDQFTLRRARVNLESAVNKKTKLRILAELAGSPAVLDAYADFTHNPALSLRVGKFKGPLGLERLQSITHISFIELAFPTSLAPNRDVGLQLSGDLGGGLFSYQAAIQNGVTDGGSTESDTNDGKDYIARVFAHPFKRTAGFLQGLGLGVAASIGEQQGTAASSQLPSYRTNGQQTFFSYRSGDTFAFGDRTRVSPQAYWYHNNISLLGEYTVSEQEIQRATTTTTMDSIANRAWVVAGTWILTGEKTSYRGVKPKNKKWGALELAGRYSELRIDNKAFPRYANIATAARRAKAWTGGLNWYLNDAVKIISNYEYTTFEGGAATGNRRPERALLSRVQLVY